MSDDFFGLNLRLIVAGLSGGSVYAYLFKKSKPIDIMGSLMIGALAANYLSPIFNPIISHLIGTPELVSAFLVGAGGKAICLRCIEYCRSWTPFKG